MKLVDINFKPDQAELRKFGKTMIIGFTIIALVVFFVFKAPNLAIGLFIFGVVSFILSMIGKAAMIVYLPWMGFGLVMGTIVSSVIMALLFFLMITPIALIFKLMKRDPMHRSIDKKASSYWNDSVNRDKEGVTEYQRQF